MIAFQAEVERFIKTNDLTSLGRLCVLLFVANRLKLAQRPFSIGPLLTEQGGQISGLNGQSVRAILVTLGIDISLRMLGEAGRTNRGSIRTAELLIAWLNKRAEIEGIDAGELQFLERTLGQHIASLLDNRSQIHRSLPSNDPGFPGPRFEVRDEQLTLARGRFPSNGLDFDVVTKLSRQLERIISELETSFRTSHNSYHTLKSLFAKYAIEIRKVGADLDISALFFLGLQIEAQIDAVGTPESEDPPFDAERRASVEAFRAAHGTLIAYTPEGAAFLSAAAAYQNDRVNVASLRTHAGQITERASAKDLLDPKSAEFIREVSEFAGKGKNPNRSMMFAIFTSNGFLSAVFAAILTDYMLPAAGKLFLRAIDFVKENSEVLIALASDAPYYFQWLVDAIAWFLSVV
ncbi:MAG: hypothetical protein ACR650_11975 [Methylocystis sp.]|jgi:hypothetical protein